MQYDISTIDDDDDDDQRLKRYLTYDSKTMGKPTILKKTFPMLRKITKLHFIDKIESIGKF